MHVLLYDPQAGTLERGAEELHSRFGDHLLLVIMACLAGVQLYLLRRKKWL